MILPCKRMAGQDAGSRATEIPCSRHLLNAKRYLQADRKPSAPRPACPRETCLQQPTSSAVPAVPYELMQSQPPAWGAQGSTGEKINPRDGDVCPGWSHCRSVSLSALVTLLEQGATSHSGLSAGNTFLKAFTAVTLLRSGQRCADTAAPVTTRYQAGHTMSLPA